MKTKYYLYSLALAALFGSCESKLDIPQQGVLNMDTYYQTDEDAQEALAAIYSTWAGAFVGSDYMDKLLLADDCYSGGNGPADGGDRAGFSRAYFDTNCGLIKEMYSGYYSIINRCNLLLDKFQDAADTPMKRLAVVEARFFRAYAHMELVSMWGNPPLVTKTLTADEGRLTNTPAVETWKFIEDELKEIIESGVLTEKANVNDQQTGVRPTKQTAQAYLGKAYLFQGKYGEALVQFKEVIASGKYALAQGADYANLFHLEGNYSPEYLLSNNTVQDAANGFYIPWTFAILSNWIWGNTKFAVNDWGKWIAWGGLNRDNVMGYGFFNPTQKLADAFWAIEGKDGFRLNSTILSHDKMHEVVGAHLEVGRIIVKEDGTKEYTGGEHFEHSGWYRLKLLSNKSDQHPYTAWLGCAMNLPAMRYAELLLMAAEAGYKTGDAAALGWFNEVRRRAQAPEASALDMTLIQNEFFVETCFEGHRYQDLQRWDKNGDIDMVAVLKDKGKQNVYFTTRIPITEGKDKDVYERISTNFENASWVYYVPAVEQRAGFDAYEKLLPYPQAELNVNPNIVQNPGWGSAAEE